MDYYEKYLKYKNKYISLKNSVGGWCFTSRCKLIEQLKKLKYTAKIEDTVTEGQLKIMIELITKLRNLKDPKGVGYTNEITNAITSEELSRLQNIIDFINFHFRMGYANEDTDLKLNIIDRLVKGDKDNILSIITELRKKKIDITKILPEIDNIIKLINDKYLEDIQYIYNMIDAGFSIDKILIYIDTLFTKYPNPVAIRDEINIKIANINKLKTHGFTKERILNHLIYIKNPDFQIQDNEIDKMIELKNKGSTEKEAYMKRKEPLNS